jgi:hypothetical protein
MIHAKRPFVQTMDTVTIVTIPKTKRTPKDVPRQCHAFPHAALRRPWNLMKQMLHSASVRSYKLQHNQNCNHWRVEATLRLTVSPHLTGVGAYARSGIRRHSSEGCGNKRSNYLTVNEFKQRHILAGH